MTRTTLVLEEGCMRAIREIARREKRTMSEVVNQILAEGLQRRRRALRPPEPALKSFSMGRPRVNLADRDALEATMDA
jgi:hypothetical protein